MSGNAMSLWGYVASTHLGDVMSGVVMSLHQGKYKTNFGGCGSRVVSGKTNEIDIPIPLNNELNDVPDAENCISVR
jgi:hypothetical protein